jgi:hypothetical protein
VELSDGDSLSLGNSRRRSIRNGGLGNRLGGTELFSSTRDRTDHDQVLLSEGVLAVARVELDDGFDFVEGVDIDVERLLGDEEHDALGAGRRGQGPGVLEQFGGLDMFDEGGEVEGLDLGLGAGRCDGGEVGLEAGKERVGGAGCELE